MVAPNGVIAHMFGPIEGKRHDAFMLNESGLTPKLARLVTPNGDPYVIYGDPAYGIARNIIPLLGEPILQINNKISIVQ